MLCSFGTSTEASAPAVLSFIWRLYNSLSPRSDESSILRTKQPESEVSLPECVDSSEGVMEVEEVNSARKPEVVVLVSYITMSLCVH